MSDFKIPSAEARPVSPETWPWVSGAERNLISECFRGVLYDLLRIHAHPWPHSAAPRSPDRTRSPSRGLAHPHPRPKSPVSGPHPTLCFARHRRASGVLASRASSAALLSLSHADFVLSLAPDVSTKATRQVVPMNPVMPAHGTSMPRTGPSIIGSTGHTSARAEKTPLVLP